MTDKKKIISFVVCIAVLVLIVVGLSFIPKKAPIAGDRVDKLNRDATYADALAKYSPTQRIIFDKGCTLVDKTEIHMQNEGTLMVENQSGAELPVRFLGATYIIKPHSFTLQPISVPHLPAGFDVGCLNVPDKVTVFVDEPK